MQVMSEKIHHIDAVFEEPEPFYNKSNQFEFFFFFFVKIFQAGNEEMPIYKNDQKFKSVFYYNPLNCGYVSFF